MDNHNLKIKETIVRKYRIYNYGNIATIVLAESRRQALIKAFRYFGRRVNLRLQIVRLAQ